MDAEARAAVAADHTTQPAGGVVETPAHTAGAAPGGPGGIAPIIARLAALDRVEYDRVRKAEAERLGLRVGALDEAVRRRRAEGAATGGGKQGQALSIAAPEPWPEAVDGAALLSDLAALFGRHLALSPEAADALAAWTVHTYVYEQARHTPRLAITSAERRCGKTTLLELLGLVVCKPLPTANITTAAVFRTVDMAAPTLLVDEADTFLARNQELRGVLNAGHKRGGAVIRCVGEEAEPRQFDVFAPAAVAAIGRLPDTLADRSITVTMRRAAPNERPEPVRRATEREAAALARRAARWAADHGEGLAEAEPAMPASLASRAADNWRVLFALAAAAGVDWPARLARAAAALSRGEEEDTLGVALLRDVQRVFVETPADRLSTAAIVLELNAMEDRPWPEVSRGRPLTTARFTRMVKPYGAKREQWREGTGRDAPRVWGFTRAGFADAFARYLSDRPAESGASGDTLEALSGAAPPQLVTPSSMSPDAPGDKARPYVASATTRSFARRHSPFIIRAVGVCGGEGRWPRRTSSMRYATSDPNSPGW